MALRTLEPWVSKTELCKYLNVHKSHLEGMYGIFSEGIHFRHKNPLNKNSRKVWKISKVEQLLCDSTTSLTRRLKRVKWPALIFTITKRKTRRSFNSQSLEYLFICSAIFSTWNTQWNIPKTLLTLKRMMELHEEFKFWTLIKKAEAIKSTIKTQENPVVQFFLKLFLYHSFMKTAQEIQDTFWCGEEVSLSKIDQLPSFIRRDYFFH